MTEDANLSKQAAAATMVTQLLNQAGSGDPQAAAELLPLVYAQLRKLAASRMRQERDEHTLEATALVHEAYLRLVSNRDHKEPAWNGRWHFFSAAAEAMRRILVDAARKRDRHKRGGGQNQVNLDAIEVTIDDPPTDLLALDEALQALAGVDPKAAELVKLRYFGGLTMEEAAEALGISTRTAGRTWAYARAWLYARITSTDQRGSK